MVAGRFNGQNNGADSPGPAGLPRWILISICRFRPNTSSRPVFLVAAAILFCFSSGVAFGQAPAEQADGSSPPAAVGNATKSGETAQSVAALAEAQSLLHAGKVSEAETTTRQFLQGHADSADGHFLLGYILFREIQTQARAKGTMQDSVDTSLAQFRDAHAKASLAEFTLGAKYHEPGAFDLKIVALDYVLLGDDADADKWLTHSIERNPADSDAWYNLGRTKYTENRFEEAVHAFEECLKLAPKNVRAEDNLGLSYYGLGRADDALAAYKTAIEWQSQAAQKDPEPFIDLGTLYLEQNRPKDALPYLLEATRVAPGDAKGHEKLGKAFSQLDELPKAQSELEKAVELAPKVASLHYMLGQVYRREGLTDKAKAEFQRTEELNGTHSSSQKTME
jgi:tetratricopeptide (TPR) repeat protein